MSSHLFFTISQHQWHSKPLTSTPAALEAFIIGTALCSTSLGTTFVAINSASTSNKTDYAQTRIGTVLISAAILDDVCGLVLVSVIHQLRGIASSPDGGTQNGGNGNGNLGWIIGRPILASGLLAVLTPLAAKFVLGPLFRRFLEPRTLFVKYRHRFNFGLMTLMLCAFLAIAAYAGASVLFGAFLAGTVLSSLPSTQPSTTPTTSPTSSSNTTVAADTGTKETEARRPDLIDNTVAPEQMGGTFSDTFETYLSSIQRYILQPLFFASIGFAIPFLQLWTGEFIWKGIVFSILMVFSKLVVGVVVPLWDLVSLFSSRQTSHSPNPSQTQLESQLESQHPLNSKEKQNYKGRIKAGWPHAALLGTAMVARGEIGLLIIQIGLNETPFLTQKGFVIAIWAIVLDTIIGPVVVGMLLKRIGTRIVQDETWGVQVKGR